MSEAPFTMFVTIPLRPESVDEYLGQLSSDRDGIDDGRCVTLDDHRGSMARRTRWVSTY